MSIVKDVEMFGVVNSNVLLDACFCFFAGQSVAEGAEFEANGGFHV